MSLPRQMVGQPDLWDARPGTNQTRVLATMPTNAPVEINAEVLDLQMGNTNQPGRLMVAERSVTIEGRVHRLPDPFLVIATQNPFEQEGVFPLPESNLDRFLFKIYIDYTDLEHEVDMLRLPHTGVTPDMLGEIMPLLGIVGLDKARIELDATIVPEEVARYVVGVVRKTRVLEGVMLGASSRAAIHLMSATKANARLEGRDTVTIDDVRTMAQYVLPHRLIIEDDEVSPADALQYALDNPILSEP